MNTPPEHRLGLVAELVAERDELLTSLSESMQISRDMQDRLTTAQKERDKALGIAASRLESMTRQAETLKQLTEDCTELRRLLESQALRHRQFEQMLLRYAGAVAAVSAMQAPKIYVQAVPDGCWLAPNELTEEMHAAAVRTIVRCSGNNDFPRRVWGAFKAVATGGAR